MGGLSAGETEGDVPFDRGANLLGALSLVLGDRTAQAISEAAGQPGRPGSETAAAALSALHHVHRQATIERLGDILGLTSSGTVRLVDRLERRGLVARGSGDDGRTSVVSLTDAGRTTAKAIGVARAAVLAEALAVLDLGERQALERIVSRMLVGFIREPGAKRWMCRLCDTGVCGFENRTCPVTRAAFARYGA